MTDDPQRAAFLAAILEAHDDVTPRLVYADWLDEAHPDRTDADRRLAAAIRLNAVDEGCVGEGSVEKCRWRSRGGFVEEVDMNSSQWLAHASNIVAHRPIRLVRLLWTYLGRLIVDAKITIERDPKPLAMAPVWHVRLNVVCPPYIQVIGDRSEDVPSRRYGCDWACATRPELVERVGAVSRRMLEDCRRAIEAGPASVEPPFITPLTLGES